MTAFLSVARHSDTCECPINTRYYGLECACSDRALEEVTRILADTEPVDSIVRSVHFLNSESGRMWAMEYIDERLALAESLSAFIASEV